MEHGNVLVIGNSGVGKSTLINAVLGEDVAQTGFGTEGTTKRLEIFENKELPFRIIDTVGFEPSIIKEMRAINSVRKWSRGTSDEEKEDRKINCIWFCVDGTAGKLFPKTINSLLRATSMWKTVPIIVVITKSYSEPDRIENKQMVIEAFEKKKRKPRATIPVVASTFTIKETAFAPPEGITELIDLTNELMPEGRQAATNDLNKFKLNRKRALAYSLVGVSTGAAVGIGAAPVPVADALLLSTLEVGLINGLAKLYEFNKEEIDLFQKTLKLVIPIGAIGKKAVGALKAVPGLRIGASVIQAIVAGTIVAAIGQGSIYIFEKVYKGEESLSDNEWINKVFDEQFSEEFVEKIIGLSKFVEKNMDWKNLDFKAISQLITDMFAKDTQPKT